MLCSEELFRLLGILLLPETARVQNSFRTDGNHLRKKKREATGKKRFTKVSQNDLLKLLLVSHLVVELPGYPDKNGLLNEESPIHAGFTPAAHTGTEKFNNTHPKEPIRSKP